MQPLNIDKKILHWANYGSAQLKDKCSNIGTQSVQELFFVVAFAELFTVMIWLSFFGCDVQQERNWEFMMYIPCYIGNGKIAK